MQPLRNLTRPDDGEKADGETTDVEPPLVAVNGDEDLYRMLDDDTSSCNSNSDYK